MCSRCLEVLDDRKNVKGRRSHGAAAEDWAKCCAVETDIIAVRTRIRIHAGCSWIVHCKAGQPGERNRVGRELPLVGFCKGSCSRPGKAVRSCNGPEVRYVISQRIPAAHRGLAISKNIPSKACAWPKVGEVSVMQSINPVAKTNESLIREKVSAMVVFLA